MKKLLHILLLLVPVILHAQYTSIPDSNFEQALIDQAIDTEGILDGRVLTVDISSIEELSVVSKNIADLTGIEDFSAIQTLYAHANSLTHLDLTTNSNLKVLHAETNALATVSLPQSIETAILRGNNLVSLDLSDYTALQLLDIPYNALEYLNLENAIALERLELYGGQNMNLGDNLNITNCTQLKELYCGAHLTSIDLSTNIALEVFEGGNNQYGDVDDFFIDLDFSNNPNLRSFGYINGGSLERINVSNGNNAVLTQFVLYEAALSCLQVDDAASANEGSGVYADWTVPSTQEFSEDCFTVGIEDIGLQSIGVYPNPSKGTITVDMANVEIKEILIFNLLGEQMCSFKTNQIDISNLTSGTYYIRILDYNNRKYKAMVLKQ